MLQPDSKTSLCVPRPFPRLIFALTLPPLLLLRPPSRTLSPFSSTLSGVVCWISINGRPSHLLARKKGKDTASAKVEVKEGDEIRLGYGDWRKEPPKSSYAVQWSVDGELYVLLFPSKEAGHEVTFAFFRS
jgi:hypothetical protein